MAKLTPSTFTSVRPKKKCCKSSTRCSSCPLVLHRLSKMGAEDFSKKEFAKALKKVRAA
ncbi:hypothetical protein [Williamsia sp. CHRR-6]|jgi:hypothetical protein|uniref:hypothetical protein n=1 Tax=Williamsia sp. CHRR-6 TaxID=2835871 RepID=UPI001BD916B8|nr:hypothetical protein [Williamsia sp. CHRR-6]MBT0565533.1 hypothetical protein [Williamsia sp. CHRR-6]